MTYEEIANTPKFKQLLEDIPEEERAKVQEAIRSMVEDFNQKVIKPLESILKK
jgi:mRNA-degrading endonuclease RelE of RelBE toxin-antitoxin system